MSRSSTFLNCISLAILSRSFSGSDSETFDLYLSQYPAQKYLENLLDDLPSNVEKLLQLSRCFELNLFFDTLALEKLKEYFFFGFHFHLLLGCSITVSEDSDH